MAYLNCNLTVFNEKHQLKVLTLINKDLLADNIKSILLALISVTKKTMKIAKIDRNLLAFLDFLTCQGVWF
ncbi:hypothetical protein DA096_06585 [Vibrio rotiferianus]|nr:hypothetical protein DA095_05655 [Vibrio rotiferianus]TMX46379.1 hypothetical protein DA093_19650 [Vibrio rotiferianus]TMX67612.1 hypothetical protein DA096_06585 [Vibrio rotiferianus]